MKEVDEAHALAGSRLGDHLLPRRAHGQLLSWRQLAVLPEFVKVVCPDG